MRVVVWNMAHKVASWAALEKLEADIALLNEARAPKTLNANVAGGGRTEGRDGYRRPWASAVVTRHDLHEIRDAQSPRRGRPIKTPFMTSRPGSWTAAVASVPGVGEVTAISLYGLMDEKSDASVHRSLSELAPVFDDPRYGQWLLLGGDLNTWTGWEAGPHLDRDRVVLDRIRAYGLVDCLGAKRPQGRLAGCPCTLGESCNHIRTRVDPGNPDVPYQMDYLFASPALAERLSTCEAVAHESWPSDHLAIVATFEY
jgi:endonuclease/exonuclease/phosphatase (EEP) superfamily protein YafD